MTEKRPPWPQANPEAFEEAARRFGNAFNEATRQLVTLIQPALIAAGRACRDLENALDAQWPAWREFAASVPDYVPEPPYQGCHCLCAVAHGRLGACTGEAEPDLVVTRRLDGDHIRIPVCRGCYEATVPVTS